MIELKNKLVKFRQEAFLGENQGGRGPSRV